MAARLPPRRAGDTRRGVGREGCVSTTGARNYCFVVAAEISLASASDLSLRSLMSESTLASGAAAAAGEPAGAEPPTSLVFLAYEHTESRAVPREAASRTPPSRRVGRHGAARRACGNPSFAAASRDPRARRDLSLGRSPRRARGETETHQELFRVGGDLVDGRIDRISAHGDGPGRVRLRREGGRGADENGEEGELHRLRRRGDGRG